MAKKKSNKEAVRERLSEKQLSEKKKITRVLTILGVLVGLAAVVFIGWNGVQLFLLKEPVAENGTEANQLALDPAAMTGWWWTEDGNACFLLGEDRYYSAYAKNDEGVLQRICRVRYMLFEDHLVLDTDPENEQNPTSVKCSFTEDSFTVAGILYRRGEAPEEVEK